MILRHFLFISKRPLFPSFFSDSQLQPEKRLHKIRSQKQPSAERITLCAKKMLKDMYGIAFNGGIMGWKVTAMNYQ